MDETGSSEDFWIRVTECLKSDFKDTMLELLESHNWLDNMRLKCRTYIKINGTKSISAAEIMAFLKTDAFNTFPKNVMEETIDVMKEKRESIFPCD